MASKITLLFLITVTVALLVASYFLGKQETMEGFQSQVYSVNDLDINSCPNFASEIQTAKGSTDCCQGDMVDGKCNGTTFCTKSPGYLGVKTCIEKWQEYFKEKSLNVCPATMPNYFEDVTNSQSPKGCSAGPIVPDGSVPKDGTANQCKVYALDGDNKKKADSCYVEKLRSIIQCPVVNSQSPSPLLNRWAWRDNTLLAFFTCNYPLEIGMPQMCYDKKSLEAYLDNENPNWRTQSFYLPFVATNSCDNYIKRRNESQEEANKLQAEERARAAAEKGLKEEEGRRRAAEEQIKKKEEEASRLQQQLDEANSRLQTCKK